MKKLVLVVTATTDKNAAPEYPTTILPYAYRGRDALYAHRRHSAFRVRKPGKGENLGPPIVLSDIQRCPWHRARRTLHQRQLHSVGKVVDAAGACQ